MQAVIAGYKRTPFHFANKGKLAKIRADDMASTALEALLKDSKCDPKAIEDLILGCAFPEGEQGLNLARLIILNSKVPQTIAGCTINRFCGSSMQAIHNAAGMIACGAGEAFVCGGVESMSRIPMGGFNPMPNPKLYSACPGAYMSMGETAENVANRYKISRRDQEEFACNSQKKAAKAQESGHFKDEIVPVMAKDETVSEDGCLRPDTTVEGLSELKAAFEENGSVTAGTASPLTDGAAMTLVCSEEYAKSNGLEILAHIKSFAVSGVDPEVMGIGPVSATQKALARAGIKVHELDIIELNEAFAAQALACIRELGLDEDRVNLDGGAIALGHPLGATGARITGKLALLLKKNNKRYGLATQCIGGGQGIATILERRS